MDEAINRNQYSLLLRRWCDEMHINEEGHYNSAKYYEVLHRWLGYPVIVFSALVASSAYFAIDSLDHPLAKITAIAMGAISVVLSSIQSFAKFTERVESHRTSGAEFSCLRREIEILAESPERQVSFEDMNKIRRQIDSLTKNSLPIPKRYWLGAEISPRKNDSPLHKPTPEQVPFSHVDQAKTAILNH